jgi:hypothetical protein
MKTWSDVLLNKKIHILLSQAYCVRQVVKTPTIIFNNPVYVLFITSVILCIDLDNNSTLKSAIPTYHIFNQLQTVTKVLILLQY